MAVRKGDQDQGKLKVIEASKNLCKYTYERVKSNAFPKADRWIMPKSIWDEVRAAHTKIIRANAIRAETVEDAQQRILLEKEAIGHLDAAISLIDICNVLGQISDDRAAFWTKLATETQILCKAWLKSNRTAFKDKDLYRPD